MDMAKDKQKQSGFGKMKSKRHDTTSSVTRKAKKNRSYIKLFFKKTLGECPLQLYLQTQSKHNCGNADMITNKPAEIKFCMNGKYET